MLLYEWYEAQRALMSPFSEFASASSKLYNHPLSLFAHTPMAHRVSAGLELMHRLAKDYERLTETLEGMHYVAFSLLMLRKAEPHFCWSS